MDFILSNGLIKFPNFVTKYGVVLLERPNKERVCEEYEITPVEQPPQAILDAVNGKFFNKYSEAKAFLEALEK